MRVWMAAAGVAIQAGKNNECRDNILLNMLEAMAVDEPLLSAQRSSPTKEVEAVETTKKKPETWNPEKQLQWAKRYNTITRKQVTKELSPYTLDGRVPNLMLLGAGSEPEILVAAKLETQDKTYVANDVGQWFEQPGRKLYRGPLPQTITAHYERFKLAEFEEMGSFFDAPPDFTARDLLDSVLLPVILANLRASHGTSTNADAEYLAVRSGIIAVKQTLLKNGKLGYRVALPCGDTVTLPYTRDPPSGTNLEEIPEVSFQLWAHKGLLKNSRLQVEDLGLVGDIRHVPVPLAKKFSGYVNAMPPQAFSDVPKVDPRDPRVQCYYTGEPGKSFDAPFFEQNGKVWEVFRIQQGPSVIKKVMSDHWVSDSGRVDYVDWKNLWNSHVWAYPVSQFEVHDVTNVRPGGWLLLCEAALTSFYRMTHPRYDGNIARSHIASCGWLSGLRLRKKAARQGDADQLIVAVSSNGLRGPILLKPCPDGWAPVMVDKPMSPEDYEVLGLCLVKAGTNNSAEGQIEQICANVSIESWNSPPTDVLEQACLAVNRKVAALPTSEYTR